VIPCGGGGLSSGISIAIKDAAPDTAVWVAEPEHFDDTRRSLIEGARVSNEPGHTSICDAILTAEPGAITFEINRKNLAGGIAVSDRATAQAMRDAMAHLKLVVEPGGCVGLAALSSGEIEANRQMLLRWCCRVAMSTSAPMPTSWLRPRRGGITRRLSGRSDMEDAEIRAALDRHWAASDANDFEAEHQIYREDAVLDYPQSGERIRGRQNIQSSRAAQAEPKALHRAAYDRHA